jgi:hypothetical protein
MPRAVDLTLRPVPPAGAPDVDVRSLPRAPPPPRGAGAAAARNFFSESQARRPATARPPLRPPRRARRATAAAALPPTTLHCAHTRRIARHGPNCRLAAYASR